MDILGLILTILSSITMGLSLLAVTLIHLVVYLAPILFLYWCLATFWKKLDDWLDEFKEYRAKMIGKKPELVEWKPESWTEKIKNERAWAKKHPMLSFLKKSWWWLRATFWYRVPDYPCNIKWYIKRAYQRAKRGWANSDTWGFSDYLSEIISNGCKYLVKTKHGIPMLAFKKDAETDEYGNHTDKVFEEAEKYWNTVLQKIIKTFETAQHISEDHWFYQKSSEYDFSESQRYIEINNKMKKEDPELWKRGDLHIMTLQECIEYEEGWKLFQEHFFGLWN